MAFATVLRVSFTSLALTWDRSCIGSLSINVVYLH